MSADTPARYDSPAALVAIAQAARQTGDRDLLQAARRELRERYGIELTFRRNAVERQGVPSDN